MSDSLLHQMLPDKVSATLRSGGKVAARDYPEVSVLFSDIVGFSTISKACTPRMVCDMLDELYIRFDAVMELPEFRPCYKARGPEGAVNVFDVNLAVLSHALLVSDS